MPLVNQTGYAAHRAALRSWLLNSGSLTDVIWAKQATPRPDALPFGVLQIIRRKRIGMAHVKRVQNGNLLERTTIGQREASIQVTVFSAPASADSDFEAAELLEQALDALEMQQLIDSFAAAKFSVLDWSDVQEIGEQVGHERERQAVSELRISYRSVVFDDGSDTAPDDGTFIESTNDLTEKSGNVTYNP